MNSENHILFPTTTFSFSSSASITNIYYRQVQEEQYSWYNPIKYLVDTWDYFFKSTHSEIGGTSDQQEFFNKSLIRMLQNARAAGVKVFFWNSPFQTNNQYLYLNKNLRISFEN